LASWVDPRHVSLAKTNNNEVTHCKTKENGEVCGI
jgi:hypothetical protein